jgi:hypothetical protein
MARLVILHAGALAFGIVVNVAHKGCRLSYAG